MIRFTKKIRIHGSKTMANSLESEAEEDEKKENEIFLFSPQQITARKKCKQKSQYTVKFGLCTLRNKGV